MRRACPVRFWLRTSAACIRCAHSIAAPTILVRLPPAGTRSKSYAEWDVPVDAEHQSSYKCVQAGLLYALAGSGRPASLLELTAALRILLEDPNAAVLWCAGENVFAVAELAPDDPEQQAFLPWTPSDSLRSADD